ncbi:MAG: hypothetical protein IJ605_01820 [Prevotella sp.]|nr:hypothetical protein [Prevotella sp.]
MYKILLIFSFFSLTAHAQDTALVEHTTMWQTVESGARQNPALHGVAYASSFSQLYLAADWQRQSEPFVLEKGRGFLLPAAHVETYLRLSDHAAVWGRASYMNGKQHDVSWNSTTDFDLLKPHVLADTLGGDTQHERYLFEGGYATQLGRWLLGAEMLFRADHEYRDVDPRMRGIVNELTLRFGAGREAWNYHWAAAFEGSVYKQRNSVEFYRELGVIPEYQMTGLGTEYARFSGDKRSLHYDGGGVCLLLDANPKNGGIFGHLELSESRYHRKIVENYILPLTDLFAQGVKVRLGVQEFRSSGVQEFGSSGVQKKSEWALFADFDYTKRSGDEHIIGTSATSSFPDLGVLTMYKNHRLNTSLTAIYGTSAWHASARAGYKSDKEEYAYPNRVMNTAHVYGELAGEAFFKASDRLTLSGRAKAAYAASVDDKLTMPFADMQPVFVQMVNHTYDFRKANYADFSAMARGDFALKNFGLFAELGSGFVHCSVGEHQLSAHVALGVTF